MKKEHQEGQPTHVNMSPDVVGCIRHRRYDHLVRSPGCWVQLFGAGHLGVGVVVYRREITEASRCGLVDTVDDRGSLATAWWFLVAAPTMWSVGRAMRAPRARRSDATEQDRPSSRRGRPRRRSRDAPQPVRACRVDRRSGSRTGTAHRCRSRDSGLMTADIRTRRDHCHVNGLAGIVWPARAGGGSRHAIRSSRRKE